VEGMCAFVTLPAMHPFMMQNENVIQEVRNFLKTGSFGSGTPRTWTAPSARRRY